MSVSNNTIDYLNECVVCSKDSKEPVFICDKKGRPICVTSNVHLCCLKCLKNITNYTCPICNKKGELFFNVTNLKTVEVKKRSFFERIVKCFNYAPTLDELPERQHV